MYWVWWAGTKFHEKGRCFTAATNASVQLSTYGSDVFTKVNCTPVGAQSCKNLQNYIHLYKDFILEDWGSAKYLIFNI